MCVCTNWALTQCKKSRRQWQRFRHTQAHTTKDIEYKKRNYQKLATKLYEPHCIALAAGMRAGGVQWHKAMYLPAISSDKDLDRQEGHYRRFLFIDMRGFPIKIYSIYVIYNTRRTYALSLNFNCYFLIFIILMINVICDGNDYFKMNSWQQFQQCCTHLMRQQSMRFLEPIDAFRCPNCIECFAQNHVIPLQICCCERHEKGNDSNFVDSFKFWQLDCYGIVYRNGHFVLPLCHDEKSGPCVIYITQRFHSTCIILGSHQKFSTIGQLFMDLDSIEQIVTFRHFWWADQ